MPFSVGHVNRLIVRLILTPYKRIAWIVRHLTFSFQMQSAQIRLSVESDKRRTPNETSISITENRSGLTVTSGAVYTILQLQ